MSKHRVRHHLKKAGVGELLNIGKTLSTIAPYIAFAQQLTAKDMAVLPAGRTYAQQGKDFVNIITGRMGGFHLFNAASDYKPPFTWNPAAIVSSPWVKGGIGGIAYGLIGTAVNRKMKRQIIPKAAFIGKLGSKVAFSGAIGALFDAPNGSTTSTSTYTAPAPAGSTNTLTTYSSPTVSYSSYPMGSVGIN